jgi:hypothetical protein
MEGILQKLAGWGMQVSRKENGSVSELEVKCPYAESVHPRLSTKEPKCPLGEYILGAIRLEDSKSHLLRNDVTKEGVRFTIQRESV